ncbi:hypothetical protein CWI38_0166p0010 [Hamiltosporidium tvaerminnensis]|uniref:Uncharacterized protein n=1 Tax=Hamiltosporidium tvaerminnensis TaxID=1176355 RepID=A0A4Q9M013_9MICR|nr:hypothetical protein CWI38_0166p0010 [Hamiltosporidium tvaerminnensis]
MEISNILEKILNKEKVISIKMNLERNYSLNESVEEMSDNALLCMSIYFIQGYLISDTDKEECIEFYKRYCEEVEYYRIINKSLIKIKENTVKQRITRDQKLFLYNFKKEFREIQRIWDNREYIFSVLKYLYILAFEEIYFLLHEREIIKALKEEKEEFQNKEINIIRVDERGKRSSVMVNRNKPTMDLDEFADREILRMRENSENQKEIQKNDSESGEEENLEELRRLDELKDEIFNKRGNTYGMG